VFNVMQGVAPRPGRGGKGRKRSAAT
jgi:hypothetical protein